MDLSGAKPGVGGGMKKLTYEEDQKLITVCAEAGISPTYCRLYLNAPEMLETLEEISLSASYGTEEDPESGKEMLIRVGFLARNAIVKAECGES